MAEILFIRKGGRNWFKSKSALALLLYAVVAVIHLYSIGGAGWLEELHFITRGLHMPVLIIWVLDWEIKQSYKNSSLQKSKIKTLLVGALLASWIGDIFVLYENQAEHFFMLGLCFFMFTHVLLAWGLSIAEHGFTSFNHAKKKWLSILSLAAVLVTVYLLCYSSMGEVQIPVAVYIVVFLAHIVCAIDRQDRTSKRSFQLVFAGCIVFIISDSILGCNKFLTPLIAGEYFTSITYLVAQVLTVIGLKIHIEK